jgi:type II secretory pathway pseudopilin PulG
LIELMIIVVIVGILTAIAIPAFSAARTAASPEHQRELYDAWCQVHTDVHITFEDWQLLRENNLLPRQDNGVTLLDDKQGGF